MPKMHFSSRILHLWPGSRALCTQAERWHLHGAVCLQRFAVISADRSPAQQALQDYLTTIEHEDSLLSDHELHEIEDKKVAARRKLEDSEDAEQVTMLRQTAQDLEKMWEQQVEHVRLAPRITVHDKSNNVKSADRLLHRPLTLLVKRKFGEKEVWSFPQTAHRPGESMRQTAERALTEHCGISGRFMGNAPCGFFKYKYPAVKQEEFQAVGVKVFVFKAQLLDRHATITPGPTVTDFMWITKDELTEEKTGNLILSQSANKFVMEL